MKPLYRMFYGLTISLTGPYMAQLKEGKGLQKLSCLFSERLLSPWLPKPTAQPLPQSPSFPSRCPFETRFLLLYVASQRSTRSFLEPKIPTVPQGM